MWTLYTRSLRLFSSRPCVRCCLTLFGATSMALLLNVPASAQSAAVPALRAEQSFSSIGTAAASQPSRQISLEERADIMMARKRFDEAIELLQQAIAAHPRQASLYNKIGINYQQLLDAHHAERYYKSATKLNPRMAEAYNNLGTVYYGEHKWKKAYKLYDKAISLREDMPAFYVNRGTVEFVRGKTEKAKLDYQKALRLDPNALDPSSDVGTVVQDRAVTDVARYHFLLAKLFCSMGKLDDAMHQFRQALEQHYSHIRDVFKDDTFKPLRARQDFVRLMSKPNQSES